MWEGETPQGTCCACAIMLSYLGSDKDAIKAHVGWKTDQMFKYGTSKNLHDKKKRQQKPFRRLECLHFEFTK